MLGLVSHVISGGRAIYIVPEQASFMAERDIYSSLGALSQNVRVTSFTRLSEQILKETGSGGLIPLDTAGRYLLMAMALGDVSDLIHIYRRHTYTAAFVDELVGVMDELKTAGITPPELLKISGGEGGKLSELALIMDAYEALVSGHFADGTDIIKMAAGRFSSSDILRGTRVFIDSFAGFTAPEYRAIEAMLSAGCSVDITLCHVPGDSRFDVPKGTFKRLRGLCGKMGLPEPEHIHLPESRRFLSDEVAFVAEEALTTSSGQWAMPGRDAAFIKAASAYEELVFAASEINRLVREENYRYRDITLIARDLGRYNGYMRPVFERYGIPLFVDAEEAAASKMLISLLQAAIKSALKQDGISPVIELAKSPAMGFTTAQSGEFENYCFVWQVKPGELNSEFSRPIDGFSDNVTERGAQRLKDADSCRAEIAAHLKKLREGFSGGTAAHYAQAIYTFLTDINFGSNAAMFLGGMSSVERRDFLDEQALLWDSVINILDLFGGVMGGVFMEPSRFAELFILCLSSIKVAMPPRTLDEVTFGTADRIRPDNPGAVFILGAVEGEFPLSRMPERLLGESERRILSESGFDLIRDADYLLSLEEYNCACALGSASKKLYISYPSTSASGETIEPSVMFLSSRALFLEPLELSVTAAGAASTLKSAFMSLTGDLSKPEASAIKKLLSDRGYEKRISELEVLAARPPRRLLTMAKKLFGGKLRLSPSQLERYYTCPFQYFMRDGVRIRPRRRAVMSPIESGTLIHEIVGKMVTQHGGKGLSLLSPEEIASEAEAIAREFIAARVGADELMDSRLNYLISRVAESGAALVKQLAAEFAQSLFEPIATELVVGENGVKPLAVESAEGSVTVEGRVDRVDMAELAGMKYVRVVDYKSGGKTLSLSDVFHGIGMQMLIYLFAIWENGEGQLDGALPAGVLYMPTSQKYLTMERDTPDAVINKKRLASYKMNGLVLNDAAVILAMESGAEGVFVPKPTDKNQLATIEEMQRLMAHVKLRVSEMSDYLSQGNIEAVPSVGGGSNPCGYCDYRGVCGFEETDRVRFLSKMPRESVLGGEADGANKVD